MYKILTHYKRAILLTGFFSLVAAALQFVLPLYMLSIYNRVVATGSLETLQAISLIAIFLLLVMGVAEFGRQRLQSLISIQISQSLIKELFEATITQKSPSQNVRENYANFPRTQPLQDLSALNNFVVQGGIAVAFDAILSPIFVIALFVMSKLIGVVALIAALLLMALAIYGEYKARHLFKTGQNNSAKAQVILEGSIKQEDSVLAMGMGDALYNYWNEPRSIGEEHNREARYFLSKLSSLSKSLRMSVQISVLGLGAYLVITTQSFLAGAIIASSILMGRALAPIDQSIALWKVFVDANSAAKRLEPFWQANEPAQREFELPPIQPVLNIDAISVRFEGKQTPIFSNFNAHIGGGQSFAIMGANATGKTTILRALAGIEPLATGEVKLDFAKVEDLTHEERGRYVGYLPQDIQLFPGTIAENIARFKEIDEEALHLATQQIGAFDLIMGLPNGYLTEISQARFSAGQKQLIGLARAFYSDPEFLFLDEPTANLDDNSKLKFREAITQRNERGLVSVFVTHEPQLLGVASQLAMFLGDKLIHGDTNNVLNTLRARAS